MKKLLSVLMTAALLTSISMSAFAAELEPEESAPPPK